MAIGTNFDPEWSQEEFADEVMLAGRFDADAVDAAIWNADPSVPDEDKFYEVEEYDHWNDVEQGRYDDDPNPYHGDYADDF